MEFFDSHMHLNSTEFLNQETAVWQEALAVGVTRGAVIGYDIPSSLRAIELAEQLPGMIASVGVSPHDIAEAPDDSLERLESLAQHPRVAALGECGLEYYHPGVPKETQIEYFTQQIELANRLHKPVVIHLRDADDDFMHIMESTPPQSAILHCFTGSLELMEKAVSKGYMISFSGILTFKNARDLQTIAPRVPLPHLLIETDAPYLAPVPYRGKRCEPKMVIDTAGKVAELCNLSVSEIAQSTRENAMRVFDIKD